MVIYPIKQLSNYWNRWTMHAGGKSFAMHLSQDCNDVNVVRECFSKLTGQGKRFSTFVIDPATAQAVGV